MTTDVGTEPRKRLTPRQLLKLFEQHKGVCVICGFQIDAGKKWVDTLKGEKGFIDEHGRPLGLGGSNDLSNRGPAHIHCAEGKTVEDKARINKAKAQKRRHLGIIQPTQKIPSQPFPISDRKKKHDQAAAAKLPVPPRRAIFRDIPTRGNTNG
jgi:hypothetical protein